MSGTKAGGQKTALTIKAKYGKEYYAEIGKKGGGKSSTGGFASKTKGKDGLTGSERARIAGRKGGKKSKRSHPIVRETEEFIWYRAKNGEIIKSKKEMM